MPGPYRRVPGEETRVASGGPAVAAAAAPSSGNSSAVASLGSSTLAGGAGDGGQSSNRTPSERLLDKAYARELVCMGCGVLVCPYHGLPRECIVDGRMVFPLPRVLQHAHRRKINLPYCFISPLSLSCFRRSCLGCNGCNCCQSKQYALRVIVG